MKHGSAPIIVRQWPDALEAFAPNGSPRGARRQDLCHAVTAADHANLASTYDLTWPSGLQPRRIPGGRGQARIRLSPEPRRGRVAPVPLGGPF